jgi:hypothetical protein
MLRRCRYAEKASSGERTSWTSRCTRLSRSTSSSRSRTSWASKLVIELLPAEGVADPEQQVGAVDRLGDEVTGAGADAIELRHHHIEQNDVRLARTRGGEPVEPVLGLLDNIPVGLQQLPQQLAVGRLIVHDQDAPRLLQPSEYLVSG